MLLRIRSLPAVLAAGLSFRRTAVVLGTSAFTYMAVAGLRLRPPPLLRQRLSRTAGAYRHLRPRLRLRLLLPQPTIARVVLVVLVAALLTPNLRRSSLPRPKLTRALVALVVALVAAAAVVVVVVVAAAAVVVAAADVQPRTPSSSTLMACGMVFRVFPVASIGLRGR